jgi:hypothetical protein
MRGEPGRTGPHQAGQGCRPRRQPGRGLPYEHWINAREQLGDSLMPYGRRPIHRVTFPNPEASTGVTPLLTLMALCSAKRHSLEIHSGLHEGMHLLWVEVVYAHPRLGLL